MEKVRFNFIPLLVEKAYVGFAVRFNVEQVETQQGTQYQADQVIVNFITYDSIVSGIIHHKYSLDDEIALINNYINNPQERQEQ